jgi:hypothetical protein
MGTTLDALNAGYANVTYVAMIEGYDHLITSGDPFASFNAFDNSLIGAHNGDITGALGGLTVDWAGMGQEVDPWRPFGDAPTLRLIVAPAAAYPTTESDDHFGVSVHKQAGGHETPMGPGASVDCNDLSVTGRHSSGFAASGVVNIGPEAMIYSSVTGGGVFTISERGYCSPFQTESGARFARSHRAVDPTSATGAPIGVTIPPLITDEPRQWIGRWVGVWILRNNAGSLDTTDEGHLAYAGTIASIGSDEAGRTVIELDHALTKIYDTVIHRDPYRAQLVEGCNLTVGQQFGAGSTIEDVLGATAVKHADALTVVSGAPGSVNEIQAGRYTIQEIADAVNAWLRSEEAANNIDLHCQYTAMFSDASGGIRGRWEFMDPAAGTVQAGAWLSWPDETVAAFMGWDEATVAVSGATSGGTLSENAPLRWRQSMTNDYTAVALGTRNPTGTWISQNSSLPVAIKGTSTTIDGILRIDGIGTVAARRISDTSFEVTGAAAAYFDQGVMPRKISVESEATLEVTQIVAIESTFKWIVMQLILSTGTANFNAATYDALPEPMGCAIPYSILGADFEADMDALANTDAAATIILTKPTRFGDLMHSDFLMRWATLVWGGGRIQCRAWNTPLAGYASVSIGESSKATPAGTQDRQRSSWAMDAGSIFNVVKFEYGADSEGKIRDDVTVLDLTSARDYGAKAVTITARNAARSGPSAESIEELIASFSGTMAMFSRPFFRVTRPMAPPYFEQLIPLTVVAYTDPHFRNPTTGLRGVTAWPALVIGSAFDWGGTESGVDGAPTVVPPSGTVTLMLLPRIIAGTYSPACKIDDTASGGGYSAGYSAAVPGFKVYTGTFSDGAAAVDSSYFADKDKIRIIEIDPSVAGSPTTWTAEIDGTPTSTDIVITAALGAPAWDPAKKYVIIPDTYSVVQTPQQDKTFQADDADGLVENARNPYGLSVLGSSQDPTFTVAAATTLPSRPSTYAYGDGKPLDVAYEFQAAELANNMVSYKTAPMTPEVYDDTRTHSGTGSALLTDVIIVGIGEGRLPAPVTRKLYFAPRMRSTDGNTATVRVSLCKLWPQGDALGDAIIPEPSVSVTFTTTSMTFVTPTAQDLDVRHCNSSPGILGGVGFLCVELVKGGSSNVEYEGPALIRLGPLVPA